MREYYVSKISMHSLQYMFWVLRSLLFSKPTLVNVNVGDYRFDFHEFVKTRMNCDGNAIMASL